MKILIALLMIATPIAIGLAEDEALPSPSVAAGPASGTKDPGDGVPIKRVAPEAGAPGAEGPRVSSEAKWEIAGYNNNEIVYTIFLTSHDPRILRCTTVIQGWYLDNGEKQQISDRQITTVFPDQPAQVGNWMGLDQNSGATYSVNCHPI